MMELALSLALMGVLNLNFFITSQSIFSAFLVILLLWAVHLRTKLIVTSLPKVIHQVLPCHGVLVFTCLNGFGYTNSFTLEMVEL